ncbi:hypothetical protein ACFX11_006552 [Malus domestica]
MHHSSSPLSILPDRFRNGRPTEPNFTCNCLLLAYITNMTSEPAHQQLKAFVSMVNLPERTVRSLFNVVLMLDDSADD